MKRKKRRTVGKRRMKNAEEAYIHCLDKFFLRYHRKLTMKDYQAMNALVVGGNGRFIDGSSHKDKDRTRWVITFEEKEYFVVFSKNLDCILTFLPLEAAEPMEVSPAKKFYRKTKDFSRDFILTYTCMECKEEYTPQSPNSKYCSEKCEGRVTKGIRCPTCGGEFMPEDGQQIYCGKYCNKTAKCVNKRRKQAALEYHKDKLGASAEKRAAEIYKQVFG